MAGQGSLCMQLSPLYHRDEGIEEGSRNMFLCMKQTMAKEWLGIWGLLTY